MKSIFSRLLRNTPSSRAAPPDLSAEGQSAREELAGLFESFRTLLDVHGRVLAIMGDMEEKSLGEYLFDMNYIRRQLETLFRETEELIRILGDIDDEAARTLTERYDEIRASVEANLPWARRIPECSFTLPIDKVSRQQNLEAGAKMASLGQVTRLGLRVPRGFVVTTSAFEAFYQLHNIAAMIPSSLPQNQPRDNEALQEISDRIVETIQTQPLPEDVVREMEAGLAALPGDPAAITLRSSSVDEGAIASFAGQYRSFLNVPRKEMIAHYRRVLASAFHPRALYYALSHTSSLPVFAMAVGVSETIHAKASGLVYTNNPLDSSDDSLHVYVSYGLGHAIVNGDVNPDVFCIDRTTRGVTSRSIARKELAMVPGAETGTHMENVAQDRAAEPAISDAILETLADAAIRIEAEFDEPQDIEFAIDANDDIVILQTRPLLSICPTPVESNIDLDAIPTLAEGGSTACPGAALGTVAHVHSLEDLASIESGSLLIARSPLPEISQILPRMAGLITEIGGTGSHLATIARELRLPSIFGLARAMRRIPAGSRVTLNATDCRVHHGEHPDLVAAKHPDYTLYSDTAIFKLLRSVLKHISPLNLVNPADSVFGPGACTTVHDIVRFSHQHSLMQLFEQASSGAARDACVQLKTSLPLPVHILSLDRETSGRLEAVDDTHIPSTPMSWFWKGMLEEKWPFSHPDITRHSVHRSHNISSPRESQFTESSFAVISPDYCLVSLRLGYHFTSVEAVSSHNTEANQIRLIYKGGGAADARRKRRIALVQELLDRLGFTHSMISDYIDCSIQHVDFAANNELLCKIGRLVMLTKQLDMALSNERITRWYTEEFARKLGIDTKPVAF